MNEVPLHLLCVEPRFPGRLGAIADWLVRHRGYRCQFFCQTADSPEVWPASVGKGLDVVPMTVGGVGRATAVPWTRDLERGLCHAYAAWETLQARRSRPVDLVLGRSAGLGSTLFVPAALADVPIVNIFDYFYAAHEHDLAAEFGPDTPSEYFHWRRSANAMTLLELEATSLPWVHMTWQRELFPEAYRADFFVLHDGVDTRLFKPRPANPTPEAPRTIAGRTIPDDTKVISFVARSLDRVRGFDRFMRLADRLVGIMPNVLCVVAGGGQVERGLDVTYYGKDYKAHVWQDTPPADPEKFWFLGPSSRGVIAELLAATDLHVYPSRSYPISRSLLEAMASGAPVLAWDNDPVREVIDSGQTGLLVPPDNEEGAVWLARGVLRDPKSHRAMADAGQKRARERYSQDVVLPRLARRFALLAAKGG
jgi:glycosyltransferase involved in cell wall biosynthesis